MRPALSWLVGLLLAAALAPTEAGALTRGQAMRRAQDWVDAALPYCQCPNFGYDRNGYCGGRRSHPEWDPYRSDCSGLVS